MGWGGLWVEVVEVVEGEVVVGAGVGVGQWGSERVGGRRESVHSER